MYKLIRNLLFTVEAERVHHWAMNRLDFINSVPPLKSMLKARYKFNTAGMAVKLWGITFPHPIGLAAGFDKDARYITSLASLGFSFIEIGTVTPLSQVGNPQPRLFRLPADKALINRMGFNNKGVISAAQKIRKKRDMVIIGGNIGKNKDTPNSKATEDYLTCLEELYKVVNYFVVNVSSPNTPGLRELQEKEPLTQLLLALQQKNKALGNPKPILLKIAPDLTFAQIDDIIDIVAETQIAGIVATNTTLSREGLKSSPEKIAECGAGGLSGAPLKQRSTEVI
ncbi:MAG: quinone-dependent dihydroorotate dehydrogenase, partial [Chitinophagia bacterium]|nr:quinone-dependent dihydroorotate dehydrogenase [Chitinophagia bacterium]